MTAVVDERPDAVNDRDHESPLRTLEGLDGGPAPRWLTSEAIERARGLEGAPFDASEYRVRLEHVRQRMERLGLDVLIVFRPSNVEYLCGYHTEETAPQPLVVTPSTTSLYAPDLEVGRALTSGRVDRIFYCSYTGALQGLRQYLDHAIAELPANARVGLERSNAATPPRALELVTGSGVTVVDSDYLVERERLVLSPAEIRCVERAALVSAEGEKAGVAATAQRGATESSIAAAISGALLREADSASAWGPVVVTGNRAGVPHSSYRADPVGAGPTFMEFSGTHHRYHAPVMRTTLTGPPTPAHRALIDLSRATVDAVLENARPGILASKVAQRARHAIGRLPDDVVFHELFGYPVGLAHKPHWMDGIPFHIAFDNQEPLEEGMVFHIPASFRRFGHAGVGISQTFLIENGGARVLTHGASDIIDLSVEAR